ncbi:hypothetical protein M3Y99_00473400 [Aphelenchoides fujianensis]|nr:hypothetical protein M3Y99_00473400 [Aphelenchoides fujianensis]
MKELCLMSALFFFALNPARAEVFSWPFVEDEYGMVLNASVGTPEQCLTIAVVDSDEMTQWSGLLLGNRSAGGRFNVNASTSFNYTGVHYDGDVPDGVNGWDILKLDGTLLSQTFPRLPFGVFTDGMWLEEWGGALSFRPSLDGSPSFVEAVLEWLNESKVVLTYDKILTNSTEDALTGLVSFGIPTERCGNDWFQLPLTPWNDSHFVWSTPVEEFSFHSYSFDSPGDLLFVADSDFYIPASLQQKVYAVLGGDDWGRVACDTTVLFSLFLDNGLFFDVYPEDYINRQSEVDGRCEFLFDFGPRESFSLPPWIWSGSCVQLDYSSYAVRVATRVEH